MNDIDLISLAKEHIAQAFNLIGQVAQRHDDDRMLLGTSQSRLASATRHLNRVVR